MPACAVYSVACAFCRESTVQTWSATSDFSRASVPVLTSNNTAYIVQQVVASLGREGVFAKEGTDYSVEMGSILRSVSVTRIVQSSD